jgi:acyl-CoA thioesterase-1
VSLVLKHVTLLLSVVSLAAIGCAGAAVPARTSVPSTAGGPTSRTTPEGTVTPLGLPSEAPSPPYVRYVALGDSYTIGTSVKAMRRWPDQLVRALRPDLRVELVRNLAVNGYTTRDVVDEQLPKLQSLEAGLASLLIGVNDAIQGVEPPEYRANVSLILDTLLETLPAESIFVVATPDYTLTPKGGDHGDPAIRRRSIARFNRILQAEATERGIAFIDIRPVADRVAEDRSLVASDGLHPSGKQYAAWVELIAPVVRDRLLESSRSARDGG